jgi:DNA-binding SARP family transcriptional activator/DNA-binding XRE family transcriptional regulator
MALEPRASRGGTPVSTWPGPSHRGVSGRDDAGFGGLVRERRMSAGLTQRELASAAGVSIGALRDLEQGRTRCPRWGAVAAIVAALGRDQHQRTALVSAWCGGPFAAGMEYLAGEKEPGVGRPRARIGVLGPLIAVREGAVIKLGSSRQRAVLGLLALHGPAGVRRDVMVDVLWAGNPPRSAVAEVQAYVSTLRRLLDPERLPGGRDGPVTLAGHCYRLSEGTDLDLAEFGHLSRLADQAAGHGEPRLACALYERSLGLWRGEAVADVDLLQGYRAVAEAARRRDDIVQRFARAAAAARLQERVLPHLRKLCAREPLNEQAHAHLMTALAAIGQQATAVQLFDELRRRLDRQLGIRPSPQLTAAHVRILRQRIG